MARQLFGRELGLLRRASSFRLLFFATLGSGIGTWFAMVALQIDVKERTDSPAWMSALLIAEFVPMLVIGLLAGPLVDRLSRRRLLIWADLVRFGIFAVLPFATNAATIVALAGVAGFASGVFRPAVYAGLPNLVEDRELPGANSLLQTVDNVTWMVGALAGGALVGVASPDVAYAVNAATFLVSAALIARIPQRLLQAAAAISRGHWRDLAEGFALVRHSRALLTVLVAWNVGMLANAAINVAEPFLAIDAFDSGSFGLGLLMASAGVGLAVGSFLAGDFIERRGLSRVYGLSLALMAFGVGAAAAAPNVWVAAVCVVVSGAGNGAAVVCNALLVQRGAPDRVRGRVFTLVMSSNFAVLILGMVAAGPLTAAIGPRWVWAVAAVLSAIAAVIGLAMTRGVSERPSETEPAPLAEPAVQPHGPQAL